MKKKFWKVDRGVCENGLTYRTIATHDALTALALSILIYNALNFNINGSEIASFAFLLLAVFFVGAAALPLVLGSVLARRRGIPSYIGQMMAITVLVVVTLGTEAGDPILMLMPALMAVAWSLGLVCHLLIRYLIDKNDDAELMGGHINKTVI